MTILRDIVPRGGGGEIDGVMRSDRRWGKPWGAWEVSEV